MTDCAPAFDPTRDPPHSLYGCTRVMRAASIVLVTLCVAACADPAAPRDVVIDDASGSDGWRTVAAGTYNSCAIGADAAPYGWGWKLGGEPGDHRWRSISAGGISTCGVTTDDRGFCWGEVRLRGHPDPFLRLLGNGTFAGSKSPVPVAGDLRFKQIAVGTRHACGVTVDGAAHGWGNNEMGELGIGRLGI